MTKVLGLTGGIASGKSTVSNYFKEQNIPVVDADLVAREVMRAGQPVVAKVEDYFGDEVIQADGEIDREKLGQIVFGDADKRKQLDRIVRDEIAKKIKRESDELKAANHPLIVLDIPLLIEGNYHDEVDKIMVIYVDEATQKERLMNRNTELSEEDAQNRIDAQMPLDQKTKQADVLIDNNGTIEETLKQVGDWLETALD